MCTVHDSAHVCTNFYTDICNNQTVWVVFRRKGFGFDLRLEHDRLIFALLYYVAGEAFEELWIFFLVDSTQNGSGRPAAGIHSGAVGDAAR